MKTLNIVLNQQQLDVINSALAELPYRVSAPLLSYIHDETVRQLKEFNSKLLANRGVVEEEQ